MNIYRFYFSDCEKPISIEAWTKKSARQKLQQIIIPLESKGYFLENLIKETVEELIDGVSEKIVNNQKFIWRNERWMKS